MLYLPGAHATSLLDRPLAVSYDNTNDMQDANFWTGNSVVTVPLGFYPANTALHKNVKGDMINVAPGIPFGIAFIGRWWSEETLIALAYAFEQRTMARGQMKPYIRPTFELGDKETSPTGQGCTRNIPEQDQVPIIFKLIKGLMGRAIGGKLSIGRLRKRLIVMLQSSV